MYRIARLKKRGALQILLYLREKEAANITETKKNVKASLDAIYSSVSRLAELRLISNGKRSEKFPFEAEIRITDSGQKVAEHLIEVEKLLES